MSPFLRVALQRTISDNPAPMTTTQLVLLSALLHAGWNLCIKRHPKPAEATQVVVALAGIGALVCWACQTLMTGSAGMGTARAWVYASFCGVSEFVYFVGLGRALA